MLPRTRYLRFAVLAGAVGLAACAGTPQGVPDRLAQTSPQGAALVIDVRIKVPMGSGAPDPVQVFFAKIDNADGLMQQTIVRSNHVKDGRAYLLNARPGTYVAVASVFINPGLGARTYTTYFSRAAVECTKLAVGEGEVAAMGSCLLGTSTGFDRADDVQAHYKNVIAPGQATGVLAMGFGGPVHYLGSLTECRADVQGRKDVLNKARGDLAGSAWATLIP